MKEIWNDCAICQTEMTSSFTTDPSYWSRVSCPNDCYTVNIAGDCNPPLICEEWISIEKKMFCRNSFGIRVELDDKWIGLPIDFPIFKVKSIDSLKKLLLLI